MADLFELVELCKKWLRYVNHDLICCTESSPIQAIQCRKMNKHVCVRKCMELRCHRSTLSSNIATRRCFSRLWRKFPGLFRELGDKNPIANIREPKRSEGKTNFIS